MNFKIKPYIQLTRPFTAISPIIAGFLGIFIERIYHQQSIEFNLLIIYAAISMALLQVIGQVVNQLCDIDIDRINKPYRPLIKDLTMQEGLIVSLFLYTMIFYCSAQVSLTFLWLIFVGLFFSVFYSLEPIRIKKFNAWIALIWVAFARGYFPIVVMWSVYGKLTDIYPHLLGIIGFSWIMAFQATKDFNDIAGDKQYNIPTLPVKYGVNWTKNYITVTSIIPILLTILLINNWWILLEIPLIVLIYKGISHERSGKLENNLAWVGFYIGLGVLYIIFLLGVL